MKRKMARSGPVAVVLHPIAGCVLQMDRILQLLGSCRVGAVVYESAAPPGEMYTGGIGQDRCQLLAQKIAASHGAPCVILPQFGVSRLVSSPERFLPAIAAKLPGIGEKDMPLFPVGIPPELIRTADHNAARRFFGGSAAWGIAIDWLNSPQQVFAAGWEQLAAPLMGQTPICPVYAEMNPGGMAAVRGTMILTQKGKTYRADYDNAALYSETNSSRLFFAENPPLVYKAPRFSKQGVTAFYGPCFADKLFRLHQLQGVLSACGMPNALPVCLTVQNGRLTGFVMERIGGGDLTGLDTREVYRQIGLTGVVEKLESLCRCIAFYHQLGVYMSDEKLDNFMETAGAESCVVPIDTDGFSLAGCAAFPRRGAAGDDLPNPPYYHNAAKENQILGEIVLQILFGRTSKLAGHIEKNEYPAALKKACLDTEKGLAPDAGHWAECLRQYRFGLEGRPLVLAEPVIQVQHAPRMALLRRMPELPFHTGSLQLAQIELAAAPAKGDKTWKNS